MKTASVAICILLLTSFAQATEAKKSPLSFSEETTFLSPSENALIDFNKTDSFIGIVTRTGVSSSDQKTLDLYLFSDAKIKKIDKENCQTFADKVFGPSSEIELKTVNKELFRSPRNGDICEVTLRDEGKEAKFKERRFFAFISKEKSYGIVSRFNKPATEDQVEALRKFIKGLR